MAQLVVYDVEAAITVNGKVERPNTLHRMVFQNISRAYSDHKVWRWLIVRRSGCPIPVLIMDLWHTQVTNNFPYQREAFTDIEFDDVDRAIGWVVLTCVR